MDKYDRAIEYLTANPHLIKEAWSTPSITLGGSLFAFKGIAIGNRYCPSTMVVYANVVQISEAEKRLLVGIPETSSRVEVKHLPLFAAVQRHWDSLNIKRAKSLTEY